MTSASESKLDKQLKMLEEIPTLIDQRRNEWQNTTKETITKRLTEIKSDFPKVRISLTSHKLYDNNEWVQFWFGMLPSGITEHTATGSTAYLKIGAVLSFTQTYTGLVSIAYRLPYIAKLMGETEWNSIKVLEPTKVTTEVIDAAASDFFQHVIDWHNAATNQPIGFKPNA